MIEPPRHPDYKLLPHRIDWLSRHAPQKAFALYPRNPPKLSAGYHTVTYHDLATAVDLASWWLEENLKDDERVFAYSGPSDLRWSILLVASIKTGRLMIHVPPWALLDEFLSTFGECSVLIHSGHDSADAVFDIPTPQPGTRSATYRSVVVPSLVWWLTSPEQQARKYEYSETWDEAVDKQVAAFHTSGTRNISKPVIWTNQRVASWLEFLEAARRDPSVLIPDVVGKTVLSTFMPASMEGQAFQLLMPLYFGSTVVLRHPAQQLDSQSVRQTIISASCTALVAPPGMLFVLVHCPRTLALLRSLKTIVACGKGLSDKCRELLQHPGLRVQNMYGQSGAFPCIQRRDLVGDSRYIGFHPLSGAICRPHGSGHMELVFGRDDDLAEYQSPFMTKPALSAYASHELWSEHPRVPCWWKSEGRTDDRINLQHGEELHVSEMERIIGSHLLVKSALIYGDSRPKPLLVIEPWSDAMASLQHGRHKDEFISDVWPFVEEANNTCSRSAQLCRALTIVMETPVVRQYDQSIDRKRTIEMVKEWAKELYAAYAEPALPEVEAKCAGKVRTRGEQVRRDLQRVQVFREMHALLR